MLFMSLPIYSEDCCSVIFFQYPQLDHRFFTGILEVWPNSTLIAFVGFGRWKPNSPHPAMDSYVDRLQNQSYIYFKYLLTSKDTFLLPPAFPSSFSPYIFSTIHPASCTVSWGNISWHLIPATFLLLTPNASGIPVEGCWMSKKELLSSPWATGQEQEKESGLSTVQCFSVSSDISIKSFQMYNLMGKEGWLKKWLRENPGKWKVFEEKGEELHFKFGQMNMTLLYFVKHYFWFFIISSKYTGRVLTGEEIYCGKL